MAERFSATSAEESPEPQPSTSRRRYKATNMAFEEMVEMVSILRREDYDGKKGPYTRPNMRKDKIMASVVTALEEKFGTKRAKDQLRKRWSDLKSREPEQYWRIKKLLKNREKRLRQQSKDPRTSPSHQPEAEYTPSPSPRPRLPDELEEGEVEEVCKISTSASDVLVVEGQAAEPFSTDSAQRLIGQIMVWNGQIDSMRNWLDTMRQEMKNMIDVLGRIE
ncbi:hypothetical protein AB205_0079500 [Aquarana catesbeiana]|uniref:Uncharacterized protein n=1 Tax=Aquarana catesbeiana TaxID=8400 RepID=A0A2G9Q955_AQUCT|nr:hypothetical protein AB205_0079500 [Aquarana catesbeiana]